MDGPTLLSLEGTPDVGETLPLDALRELSIDECVQAVRRCEAHGPSGDLSVRSMRASCSRDRSCLW